MLKIGDVTLGLNGPAYDKLCHELEADWAAQKRINRAPALQWTGVGTEQITLSGCIFPLLSTGNGGHLGINTLKELETALINPKPSLVVDGTGRRYGYFIIRSLREERSKFITNGAPQKQEFTLVMERYGEDNISAEGVIGAGSIDLLNLVNSQGNAI